MKVKIYKQDGSDSGNEVELSDDIFAVEPNEHLIYEDVRRYLASQRQGTAKTKERGEVSGGGKKAYRQKGTGMARRGSTRSPLLKGGGTVFGPKPRTYVVRLTKKQKQLAAKSAFSLKASDNAVVVVEDFAMDVPKTKSMTALLDALNIHGKKVLFLFGDTNDNLMKSLRNIPKVKPAFAYKTTTYDVLNSDVVVFAASALDALTTRFTPQKEEVA